MTHLAKICLLIALLAHAPEALSSGPLATSVRAPRFQGARAMDVVKWLSGYTDKNFIVEGEPPPVTILSEIELTPEDAFTVTLATLESRGFTVVEKGAFFALVPRSHAGVSAPATVTYAIDLVHLTDAQALACVDALGSDVELLALPSSDALAVIAERAAAQRVVQTLRALDQPGAGAMTLLAHRARWSDALELEEVLDALFSDGYFMGDPRTNTLFALVPEAELETLRAVLSQDAPLDHARRVHVYPLDHLDADDAAQTLRRLISHHQGSGSLPRNAIRLSPDLETNSLVFVADAIYFEWLEAVLDRLDHA